MRATFEIGDQITEMLEKPLMDFTEFPIDFSAKIVQQISTGIYRSPANAVKELVSNSFDADAENVYINTHPPDFSMFSVLDDGFGMTMNEFTAQMSLIGFSEKREKVGVSRFGRSFIGMLGIGILAAAHMSRKFKLISAREGADAGFEAVVDLTRFFRTKAHSKSFQKTSPGTIMARSYQKDPKVHFTRIEFDSVESYFRNQLTSQPLGVESWFLSNKARVEPFAGFVKWLLSKTPAPRIGRLHGYDQFVWELGLACPVQYLGEGPVENFSNPTIDKIRRTLEDFRFHVFVDDVEIFKPILFAWEDEDLTEPVRDYGVYPIEISEDVKISEDREMPLVASGYFYHQPKAINPIEMRGVLARVRGVAVGLPSSNLFRLPPITPTLAYQLSGEVYVEEGLQDALNIDRSSFFEANPAFSKLRDLLEEQLQVISASLFERQERAQLRKARGRTGDLEVEMRRICDRAELKDVEFVWSDRVRSRPVEFDITRNTLTISDSRNLPKPRTQRRIALKILLCFELAYHLSSDREAGRGMFYSLLRHAT
jgi:hypothetical protein